LANNFRDAITHQFVIFFTHQDIVEPLFDKLGLNNTENKPVRENPQVIVPAQASNNDSAANEPSDRELVLQSKQGNQQCFRQLYQRYSSRVRSTLYPLCGAEGQYIQQQGEVL
jgi:hypothetical protein